MLDMEREKSPDHIHVDMTGRRHGKGYRAERGVQDEVSAQTEAITHAEKRGSRTSVAPGPGSKEAQQRRARAAWRRRYEYVNRPARQAARVECPHAEVVWRQVPHPRYGDRMPHFASRTRRVAGDHACVPGAVR